MDAKTMTATVDSDLASTPASLPAVTDTGPVVIVTGRRDQSRSRWIGTLSTAWTAPTALNRPVVALAPDHNQTVRDGMRDLLFALGKDPHVTGAAFKDEGNLDVPAAWLIARDTCELVVRDANVAGEALLRTLIELTVGVGARIWLIAHDHRSSDIDWISDLWPATTVDLDTFDTWWERPQQRPRRRRAPIEDLVASDLPASSALTFRADCRRLLDPGRFAEVDAIFVEEFDAAYAEFTGGKSLPHARIAGSLRARVREQREPWQVLTVARAIEAAAFRCGFDIDIDHHQLLNAAERNPRLGRLGKDEHAAIDAYSRPTWCAAAAIAACGPGFEEVCGVNVGDVADDGSTVTAAGDTVDVPPGSRPYLVAALLLRTFEGSSPADPLLVNRHDVRVKPQWVSKIVRITEAEGGIRLTRARGNRTRLSTDDWCVAHGVQVRTIFNGATRRRQRQ
jgi:hypothetical protein